jgi:hypothetical protein
MVWTEACRSRLTLIMMPTVLVTIGFGFSLLPIRLVVGLCNLLMVWLTLSFPLSVLVCHCMLNETE